MTFLLLALALNACSMTADNDDRPSVPLDVVGSSVDEPSYEEPAVEPSKAEAAAEPVSPAVSTSAKPPATPTVVKRTDCSFVDPDRKTDGDGKVTVRCGNDTVQAKAIYKGEGSYEFEIVEPEIPEGS